MSAPQPYIDPRAVRQLAVLPMSQLDRDRIDQAWHDLQRLVALEKAYAVGDDVHGIMAGVDPVETRESVAYLAGLLSRLMVAEAAQRDTHSRRVPVREVAT